MSKRKEAVWNGPSFWDSQPYCPDCKEKLKTEWDKEDNEACWSCPECFEWFTVEGYPAICGTSVPEEEVQES